MLKSNNTVTPYKAIIGSDESNHGQYPEIFVAVYSTFLEDIIPNKLNKSRNCEDYIKNFLGERKFTYYYHSEQESIGKNNEFVKEVIFSKLINSLSKADIVIIDGDMNLNTHEQLIDRLDYKPEVITEKDADKRYPIVNLADKIAYQLYLYFTKYKDYAHNRKYEDFEIKQDQNIWTVRQKL